MTESASSSEAPPLLELIDVGMTYESVEGAAPPAILRHLSLTVEAGESVAIIGPSGSGKSTLLNVIGALAKPTSGEVRIEGAPLYAKDDRALAAFRNRSLGFIFQSHHLLPQCSALENVLIPTLAHPDESLRHGAETRARELLTRVGLASRLSHRPGQLSGGECQRVAVVRALINEPKLVLADEPTGSLDEDAAHGLGDLLADLNREHGVTLITVTHSTSLARRMQRGCALRRGGLEPWNPDAP